MAKGLKLREMTGDKTDLVTRIQQLHKRSNIISPSDNQSAMAGSNSGSSSVQTCLSSCSIKMNLSTDTTIIQSLGYSQLLNYVD